MKYLLKELLKVLVMLAYALEVVIIFLLISGEDAALTGIMLALAGALIMGALWPSSKK